MDHESLTRMFIKKTDSIKSAMQSIDRGGLGLALVIDDERCLLGTVSDGEIRRAMLDSINLESPVTVLFSRKVNTLYDRPITAALGSTLQTLLELMHEYKLREIPLLDDQGRVVDLVVMDDLIPPGSSPMQATIMAGGLGTRLRPLTEEMPKPMLPVGGKPLLEVLLEQLRDAGIEHVNVSTHYRPEKITKHFGNGDAFGVHLNYVNEELPLGTGGALGLMPRPTGTMLVINGDVLTQVNFRSMLSFHKENQADMTMAVRHYEFEVPFGVVDSDGVHVRGLQEKPRKSFFVNAGIYLLEPAVYEYIPHGNRFNMTELVQWLLDAGLNVVNFPVLEYWLDIGQHDDYIQAQQDVAQGFIKYARRGKAPSKTRETKRKKSGRK